MKIPRESLEEARELLLGTHLAGPWWSWATRYQMTRSSESKAPTTTCCGTRTFLNFARETRGANPVPPRDYEETIKLLRRGGLRHYCHVETDVTGFLDLLVVEQQTDFIESGECSATLEAEVAAVNDTAALTFAQSTVAESIEAAITLTLAPSHAPTASSDSGGSKESSAKHDYIPILIPFTFAIAAIFTAANSYAAASSSWP